MAEDEMNDEDRDHPESDAPATVFGVRYIASPDITFVRTSPSVQVFLGDWVSVEVDGTNRLARVVLTPDLMLRCDVENPPWGEIRIATETERGGRGQEGHLPSPVPSFGGPGSTTFRINASKEEDRFRQEKLRYPPIGSPVETPDGTGVLAGLNLMKHRATVKFDANGDVRVYAVTDGVMLQIPEVSKTGELEEVSPTPR